MLEVTGPRNVAVGFAVVESGPDCFLFWCGGVWNNLWFSYVLPKGT